MCRLCVMSDRGAGSRNGGSQQGHSRDWLLDQSGVKGGEVKVGADGPRAWCFGVWTHLRGRGALTTLICHEKETIVHSSAFPSGDVATVTKIASEQPSKSNCSTGYVSISS